MIKLRQAMVGFAVLVLVAACGTTGLPSGVATSLPPDLGSNAPDASVPLAADSVATYRAYLETTTDLLVQRTRPFVDAVIAGKVAAARELYAPAHQPYARVEAVADVFGDLDLAINAREIEVPAGTTFSGFHRLERALWAQNTTAGMVPIARKLLVDVSALQALVKTVDLDPATIANGAAGLMNEVSASKLAGEEEPWSHTDLWDIEANVAGAQVAWNAVRPLVAGRAAALATTIDADFGALLSALHAYQRGTGFALFPTLTASDTQALTQLVDTLADPLSQVGAIVVSAR